MANSLTMMHDDPLSGPDDAEHGMPDDRDADPPPAGRTPPDPLDRIWRHPSEMGRAPITRAPRQGSSPGLLAVSSIAIGGSMVGALLTVGILALSGLLNGRPHPTPNDRLVVKAQNDATAQVVASVRPSVVLVTVHDGGSTREGAGVVIRHGGDILTSAWLVGKAVNVTLETDDDKKLTATVVGSDAASGLALLETDGDLPAATLAAHAPGIASSVIALSGDPHAIGLGVVSATDVVASDADGVTMANLFTIDERPPHDDAGAPVIDGRAQVAGILLPHGLGAVPIDYARDVADSIRNTGEVEHAWVGVTGVNSQYGPEVRSVVAGGPAQLGGVQPGDVVMSVNGRPVSSTAELQADIRDHWPNQKLTIVVSRDATSVTLTVTAAAPPAPTVTPQQQRPIVSTTSTSTTTVAPQPVRF